MLLHFYYVNFKKEKKDYIIIYKCKESEVSFNDINTILYKTINNEINENINFYELFYIKEGIKIEFNNNIWNDIINIYLNKINIQMIIDNKYIENIYNTDLLLFLIDEYNDQLKQFLLTYYKNTSTLCSVLSNI